MQWGGTNFIVWNAKTRSILNQFVQWLFLYFSEVLCCGLVVIKILFWFYSCSEAICVIVLLFIFNKVGEETDEQILI